MVYLIGAGPGDPGLITYKGLQILKSCDAVIYDRLGTGELLDLVRPDCAKIYVGKQAGAHYKKQEEINRILVETAEKYENVVRLKGGDSFVFGRGGEEILTLQEADIPFQVIPGVTSAIAVPEVLGIPVTHREMSRSFHVITGHTKKGEADALANIHKQEGTSVFLMGLSNLEGGIGGDTGQCDFKWYAARRDNRARYGRDDRQACFEERACFTGNHSRRADSCLHDEG